MRTDSTICRRALWAALILALAAGSQTAWAAKPVSAEKGRDVGGSCVKYDIPYDPATVREMTFTAPTTQHPFYEIVVPLGDWEEGKSASVQAVRVNGCEYPAVYVFVEGVSHFQSNWITRQVSTAKSVVIVVRAPWHNGEETTVEMDISAQGDDGAKTLTKSATATAPATGGAPAGWRRYQSVLLTEDMGLAREGEPIEFTVTARAEDVGDWGREIRVCAVDQNTGALTPVPCQIYEEKYFPGTPVGTSSDNYLKHPSRAAWGVFPADVNAKSSAVYVLFYGNPDAEAIAPPTPSFSVEGDLPGVLVENDFYRVKLSDACGQIAYMDLKGSQGQEAPRLTNSYSLAVHWNPDSYTDNGLWGHTFSWDPPEQTVVSASGPLMYRVTNSGRMPGYTPQIWTSVSYTFYATTPYVKVSTTMEVRDDTNASAIRNGEMVLDSHLVTHWVWQEKTGKMKKVRAIHGPNLQDERATRVDQDIPWIAMVNEPEDYGLGSIVEVSTAFNPNCGEATVHRPAFYLYAHHQWGIPLTYFTRAWVYPFADYHRGPIIPLAKGSTYIERMAYMPFALEKGGKRYRHIEEAGIQVRYPLIQRWGL